MISRDAEQRMLYRARQKQLMDAIWLQHNAEEDMKEAVQAAVKEAQEKGRVEGEIRLINALETLLALPVTSPESLLGRSLEELRAMSAALQEKLRRRGE